MKESEFQMSIKYKENLPEELINLAKPLEHLGISELAWNWEIAIKVIEFLNKSNYAILGGDVYKMVDGKLDSTYDSWYFNKNETKSNQELLQQSSNRAIIYINQYHYRNSAEYYYSVVFSKVKEAKE